MIHDPNFTLELQPPWESVPSEDPEQYNLRDAEKGIVVTLSAMAQLIAPDWIEWVTDQFVKLRLNAETDAARAFGRTFTIYEPIIAPFPWGRAVTYYGHDDTGRQFSFSGMITCRTIISLYMSSELLTEAKLMQAMDEVWSRIEFDRSPLPAPCLN